MIVSCQSCSTKFQVPDEKVAGKRARLPCRKCGKLIAIDARNLKVSRPPAKVSTPPALPPRPSPFPEEAREDWKVRFTDQTVTLARAEALALSMQAREDRPSHAEFSAADANMATPASAAENPPVDRVARVLDFDDGEPLAAESTRGTSPPPVPARATSRPPPPPRPRGDMNFRESSSAGRLPPPPPLPGARQSVPAPFGSQAPRPFEPPPIPKPDSQHYQQTYSSFGRLQSPANPFSQPLFTRASAGHSSYPPPPPGAAPATSPPPSYPPPSPSTYPAPGVPDSTHPPPAPEPLTGPYGAYGRAPSNPQFPQSSVPPQPSGYPVAPSPPGPGPAYAFGAAGPFSDPNVRYPTTDLTGASVIRGQAEDAASWRRRQRVRAFLLGIIIGLASVSLALCAVYLAFPDAFYKGVDALRDQAVTFGLIEKKVIRLPPGQPFATTQASQALDRAAALVQSCSRPEGPRGAGRVEVRFHRTGAVKSVELSPPFAGTDVGRCVQKAFHELTVPPYGGTEVIVVKPFSVP